MRPCSWIFDKVIDSIADGDVHEVLATLPGLIFLSLIIGPILLGLSVIWWFTVTEELWRNWFGVGSSRE